MLHLFNPKRSLKAGSLAAVATVLAASSLFAAPASAKEFAYENMLYSWMKLDSYFDYESNVDCYMRMYRNEVWQRSREDEFLRQDKRDETIEMMKARVGEANLEDVYTVRTNKAFGDYDFDTNLFEFAPVSKTTYFYVRNNNSCGLPSEIRVKFDNPEIIDGIAMSRDDAQALLTSRKRYGDIDRNVSLEIDFVLQARDGRMVQAHILDARVLNSANNRDLDGRTLAEYTGSAVTAPSSAAAPASSGLNLFGLLPGGSLQSIKDELPRGSVVCNPAGGECEVNLKTGQKLIAKIDSSKKVTALEHRVDAGSESPGKVADDLKAVYGLPINDTNKDPQAGGFTAYGQVPHVQGERQLTWRSDSYEMVATIFYGGHAKTKVVTSIRPR